MEFENAIALKEWAAVCAALETGRQSILLRKGGIDEGPRGFSIEHPEFWFFPTQFHQDASQLTSDGEQLLSAVKPPPPGRLAISLYGVVQSVAFVKELAALECLADLHVMSPEAVRKRFEYRSPGVYLAVVQIFRCDSALEMSDLPRFAGCHSWVELDSAISTSGLMPVPSESPVEGVMERVRSVTR